ncbi:MAG: hypothetical protein M3004_11455 [Bacteroidota bacterium]|nr:hypothetical protein [Bacteroidota bacterium]
MPFFYFTGFIIFLRLAELVVAKRNEQWARRRGAVEYGQGHYFLIVLLHTFFIISMIAEYLYKGGNFNLVMLIVFFMIIVVKVWVIASLGKYWNTKILRVPGAEFIKKGPYKLFRHPNYFIVICEIIIIPMVYDLYITAIIFSLLNAVMLTVRIRVEEKVWAIR